MSALLGRMPSAVGYQPTLLSEMGQMQERITSTKKVSTSVQAIYVPADDYTDPAPGDDLRTWMPRKTCRADLGAGNLPRRRSTDSTCAFSTRASSATSTTTSPAA